MNLSAQCKNLRSKSMFIPALAQGDGSDPHPDRSQSSHCWCNCTLCETGPDDQPVGPQVCRPGRPCFEE